MLQALNLVLFPLLLTLSASATGWNFVQNGTSGILALEAIIVSPTLAVFFDRASNDPLMINNNPAWGALWNLETNTASPLLVISDTFCASGGFLSNGTMVRTQFWILRGAKNVLQLRLALAVTFPPLPLPSMDEWQSGSLSHAPIPQASTARSSKIQRRYIWKKRGGTPPAYAYLTVLWCELGWILRLFHAYMIWIDDCGWYSRANTVL